MKVPCIKYKGWKDEESTTLLELLEVDTPNT